ncbi:sugar ABC transporter permease [Desulfosporosinus fructosivorans]|uniref:Sugar ABC transporter permease n=1 Tax=Desulfosporosinus fructosivorans TaxID=2018669 RepID=A0A4Z0RA68_9FIRM|nr:sugar ABC transporter permease [Desulfosporosinus fructosivorans]TGE38516.1 sugar ABC transporter permease [Desulfosporosinus fructosivorans]
MFSRWLERNIKYVFPLPAVIFVLLMMVFPIAYTFRLSFYEWSMSSLIPPTWVGLENYKTLLFSDPRFMASLWRTFTFTFAAVVVETILGIGIALLFNQDFKGKNALKTLFLLPMIATPVAIGLVWMLIFEPNIGFANKVLEFFHISPLLWLASPQQVLASLVIVDVWQWTPMIALVVLAGLSSLPTEPYEAAMVDGANRWQVLTKITLPLLQPTILVAVLLRSIDALKTFDIIYAMTGGGPDFNSETINIYSFVQGFSYFQLGMTSSLLMIFFVIVLGMSMLLVSARKRWGA